MKDKPKQMRELRKRRKKLGLVEYRVWCTPKQKVCFKNLEDQFKKDEQLPEQ